MRFNPLRDWHYLHYHEIGIRQSIAFLQSLDIVSWQNNDQLLFESALEQLRLVDAHLKVYAMPQLMTVLVSENTGSKAKQQLLQFCKKELVDLLDCDVSEFFKCLTSNIKNNCWTSLKKLFLSFKLKRDESLTPYLGTYRNRSVSLRLALLYSLILKNDLLLDEIRNAYQNELDTNPLMVSIQNLLESATTEYKYDRLSFIIASRINLLIDRQDYKSKFKNIVSNNLNVDYWHTQPDLQELYIEMYLIPDSLYEDFNDVDTNLSDDDEGQDQILSSEDLISLTQEIITEEFKRLNQYNSIKSKDYRHPKLKRYISRFNPPFHQNEYNDIEVTEFIQITNWQFNLFYVSYQVGCFVSDKDIISEVITGLIIQKPDQSRTRNYNEKPNNHSILPQIGSISRKSQWILRSEDPNYVSRISLFGFITSLILSENKNIDSTNKKKLLDFTLLYIRINKEYGAFTLLSNNKEYEADYNEKVKKQDNNPGNKNKIRFGNKYHLSLQSTMWERTKKIPKIKGLELRSIFNLYKEQLNEDYLANSENQEKDLHNIIVPDSIFYWFQETYLSQKSNLKEDYIKLLKDILKHEASLYLKEKGKTKPLYGPEYYNQNRLAPLCSFTNDINSEFYKNYLFEKLNFEIKNRHILTISIDEISSILTPKRKNIITYLNNSENQENSIFYISTRLLNLTHKHKSDKLDESIFLLLLKNFFYDNDNEKLKQFYQKLSSISNRLELDRYARLQLSSLIKNQLIDNIDDTELRDNLRNNLLYVILEYSGIFDLDFFVNQHIDFSKNEDDFTISTDLLKKLIIALFGLSNSLNKKTTYKLSPYLLQHDKAKQQYINHVIYRLADRLRKSHSGLQTTILHLSFGEKFLSKESNYEYQSEINKSNLNYENIRRLCFDPNSNQIGAVYQKKKEIKSNWKYLEIINKNQDEIIREIVVHVFNTKTLSLLKSNHWLTDIFDYRSNRDNKYTYNIPYIQNGEKSIPFPYSFLDLICQSSEDKITLTLCQANFKHPITKEIGLLWSKKIGVNFLLTENNFDEESFQYIQDIIEECKTNDICEKGLRFNINIEVDNDKARLVVDQNSKDDINLRLSNEVKSGVFDRIYEINSDNKIVFNEDSPFGDLYPNGIEIILVGSTLDPNLNIKWDPFEEIAYEIGKQSSHKPTENNTSKPISSKKKAIKKDRQQEPSITDYDVLMKKIKTRENIPVTFHKIKNGKKYCDLGFKVPQNLNIKNIGKNEKWISKIDSKEFQNNISQSRPYSFYNDYQQGHNGYVRIWLKNDNIILETRIVKPYKLEDFKLKYKALSEMELVFLGQYDKQKKYFSKLDFDANGHDYYAFEFGFGRLVMLASDQIQFRKKSLNHTRNILFFGDTIKNISIVNNKLRFTKILFSQTRFLYESAKDSVLNGKLYYTLSIDINNRITKIEYATKKGTNISRSVRPSRNVNLSKEAKELLFEKFGNKREQEIVLYGKPEIENYENNGGTKLTFDILSPDFEPSELDEVYMFFKAGKIYNRNNKYVLSISPLNDKPATNTEADSAERKYYIKKRDFSVDAYLLVRLYESSKDEKGISNILEEQVFLVRVSYDSKKNENSFSLIGSRKSIANNGFQMPVRSTSSLESYMSDQEITAIVVNSRKKFIKLQKRMVHYLRLELRPGIFFIVEINSELQPPYTGEIITFKLENRVIQNYTILVQSDIRYFSNGVKFLSILPKNNIVEIDPTNRSQLEKSICEKDFFIAAEYPNIELTINRKHISNSLTFLSNINKFATISGKSDRKSGNQKIANITLDSQFKYRMASLQVKPNGIHCIDRLDRKNNKKIETNFLSFNEANFNDIIKQIKEESWTFQDKTTMVWNNEKQEFEVKTLRNNYFVGQVPVYLNDNNRGCRQNKKNISLRYKLPKNRDKNPYELSKISLPIWSLLNYLKSNKSKVRFVTVVYLSRNKIWLEMSPGRIAELNQKIIVFKNSNKTLDLVPNQTLNTGDRLILRPKKIISNNYELERIELLKIKYSSRSSFGEVAYLPVSSLNHDGNYLNIGCSNFELTFPYQYKYEAQNIKFNTLLNTFEKYEKIQIEETQKSATSLLYSENTTLYLTINLSTEYKVVLQKSEGANRLGDLFCNEKIVHLLNAIGGHLPVTIEHFTDGIFYVSRRLQDDLIITNGQILTTDILGVIDEHVLLKAGSTIIPIEMKRYFELLPDEVTNYIVNVYDNNSKIWRNLNKSIYLHQKNEKLYPGLEEKEDDEITCIIRGYIEHEDFPGILVQDEISKLHHYIPIENASWIEINSHFTKEIVLNLLSKSNYYKIGKRVNVLIDNDKNNNSIIHREEALSYSKTLAIGAELDDVKQIKPLNNIEHPNSRMDYHLVLHRPTSILLLAEVYNDNSSKTDISNITIGEIQRFSKHKNNVLICLGKKPRQMDLYNLSFTHIYPKTKTLFYNDMSIKEMGLNLINAKNYTLSDLQFYCKKVLEEYDRDILKSFDKYNIEVIMDARQRLLREYHTLFLVKKWLSKKDKHDYDLMGRVNKLGKSILAEQEPKSDKYEFTPIENKIYRSLKDLRRLAIPIREKNKIVNERQIINFLLNSMGEGDFTYEKGILSIYDAFLDINDKQEESIIEEAIRQVAALPIEYKPVSLRQNLIKNIINEM